MVLSRLLKFIVFDKVFAKVSGLASNEDILVLQYLLFGQPLVLRTQTTLDPAQSEDKQQLTLSTSDS